MLTVIVSLILGALLLAEPVTSGMAVAAVLIIAGVALIVTPGRARVRETEASAAPAPLPATALPRREPCEAIAAD